MATLRKIYTASCIKKYRIQTTGKMTYVNPKARKRIRKAKKLAKRNKISNNRR